MTSDDETTSAGDVPERTPAELADAESAGAGPDR